MKLSIPKGCDNSPKRALIRDLTVNFVSYQLDKVDPFLDTNINWHLIGDDAIQGKDAFLNALHEMKTIKAEELHILSIVAHGKEAAVHGEMLMEDGVLYGFADFYTFKSAGSKLVSSIVSYIAPIERTT